MAHLLDEVLDALGGRPRREDVDDPDVVDLLRRRVRVRVRVRILGFGFGFGVRGSGLGLGLGLRA